MSRGTTPTVAPGGNDDARGWPDRVSTAVDTVETMLVGTGITVAGGHRPRRLSSQPPAVGESRPATTRLTRRRLLAATVVVGAGSIAGCTSPDDDDDDDGLPTPEPTPTPEQTPTETPPEDDDDADDDDDDETEEMDIDTDFDSYASDITLTLTFEDGETMVYRMEQRFDRERNRRYERVEMEGDGETFEMLFVHIDDTRYQVMEGECMVVEDVPIDFEEDFFVDDPDEVDEDAGDFTYVGTDTVDGEEVDVWESEFEDEDEWGTMTVYISTATRRVVLLTGDIEYADPERGTVHADYDHRFHSFDEDQDIEVPEGC